MEGIDFEALAAQLRKPEGEYGKEVAERMNLSNRALSAEAWRLLNLDTAGHLLELGMGNGGLIPPMLELYPSLQITGCDYSADMVAEASRLCQPWVQAGRARFVEGDVSDLPFADQAFDRAFTANTLYFYPDPSRALAEYARVLQPGGLLAMAVRSAQSMRAMPFTLHGFGLYEKQDLEALFAASPFVRFTLHPFFEEARTSAAGITLPTDSWVVLAER